MITTENAYDKATRSDCCHARVHVVHSRVNTDVGVQIVIECARCSKLALVVNPPVHERVTGPDPRD
jgi:hypothetical protein